MFEIVGTIALGVTTLTSIGGWIYAIRRNGKESGHLDMAVSLNADTLKKLPCQANPNYGREWGRILEKMESAEKRLEKIEWALEKIRQNGAKK